MKRVKLLAGLWITSLAIGVGCAGGYDPTEETQEAATADDSIGHYAVVTRELEICGEARVFLEVLPEQDGLSVEENELDLDGLVLRIPGSIRALPGSRVRMARRVGALPTLNRRLLPRPPPLGHSPEIIDAYCAEVGRFDAAIAARGRLELMGELFQLRLNAADDIELSSSDRDVAVAQDEPFVVSSPASRPADAIDQLIIYSPGFRAQAERLEGLRRASGLIAKIIAVEELPGYDASEPVPTECEGIFLSECYQLHGLTLQDVQQRDVGALFGMVSAAPIAGPTPERVADVAGLARAEIRRSKRASPSLRYVVLLGDPQRLPARFTSRNAYGQQSDRVFTLPSDFYFQEPFRPWAATGRTNYAPSSQMVWPCGSTLCATPNLDWDTRHFVWPVSFPFARTFVDPFAWGPGQYTAEELARMIAVGRIHGRDQGEVNAHLDKLEAWEAQPRALVGQAIVSVADAVFTKADLQAVKNQLGRFEFFGEGFGSGYLTENIPAHCVASRPPVNDWEAPGWDGMWGLQSQPDSCKVSDPARPGFALPAPDELLAHAGSQGFSVLMIEGHGSSQTIGLNTHEFNKRPRRQYSVPLPFDPNSLDHDNVDIAAMSFGAGRPSGLLVSSACDPGEYLGGYTATSVMAERPSFGEYFLAMPGAGGVGAFVNYLEGWYGSDPRYELRFVTALRAMHNAGTNRIGDAILSTHGALLLNPVGGLRYQVLNRHFFGDPATTIGARRQLPVHD